jgi:hypothetical protein
VNIELEFRFFFGLRDFCLPSLAESGISIYFYQFNHASLNPRLRCHKIWDQKIVNKITRKSATINDPTVHAHKSTQSAPKVPPLGATQPERQQQGPKKRVWQKGSDVPDVT